MSTQPPSFLRTISLTAVTMIFFAANSILARLALRSGEIDGGSFTAIRIFSGAIVLAILVGVRAGLGGLRSNGSWRAAWALFGYAIAFSLAYLSLNAGTGALILFGSVQITMITAGIARGDRPGSAEWTGLVAALAGLVYLVSPGLTAPPFTGAALMTAAGVGWGFYSLAARGVRLPIETTAGNFVRSAPMAAAPLLAFWIMGRSHAGLNGIALAVISGALTSGLGYAIWYTALRGLTTSQAAIVQLTVPVIAGAAGVVFLAEQLTLRLVVAAVAILGGVALALAGRRRRV